MTTHAERAADRDAEHDDDITSRLPNPLSLFPDLAKLSASLRAALRDGSVPEVTLDLMLLRGAQLVGSTYHSVALTGALRKGGESERRITAVPTWRDAPYFTEPERIALELVEAVFTPNPRGERVDDELFRRAAAVYDEKQLWTLTVSIGQLALFVPVALIAKPIPGRPIGKNYSS
jgi:alkylhydroperoxidase family enzyme